MKISYHSAAESDLEPFDKSIRIFFVSHIVKISNLPPRGHLRHGLPFFKEDVTKQARFVYREKGDTIYILRCFATHKEYEKWYQSYR